MNRLTKNERLRSRKQIEQLLTQGKSFFVHPFKVTSDKLQVTSRMVQQVKVIARRPKADEANPSLTGNLYLESQHRDTELHREVQQINEHPAPGTPYPVPHTRHPAPLCLLIAVPKRRIKKAVERNLVKRRTREAWRLHKVTSDELQVTGRMVQQTSNPATLSVMLQYVADKPLPYAVIEDAVKTIIRQLLEKEL